MRQIDERTVMFSRMTLEEGSKDYETYYKLHPEHKEIDDRLRGMPNLSCAGTAMYDPITAPIAASDFSIIEQLRPLCDGEVAEEAVAIEAEAATTLVKKLMRHYGADQVAIAKLKPYHYYSVRGRRDYGKVIDQHHKYAIVFIKEMSKDLVNRAPKMSTMIETSDKYLKLGVMGLQMASYLRRLGYPSRNHMDGNYLVIAPLLARDAGLGELGRHGLLLTPAFGGRQRIGVVTTDLELIADEVTPMHLSDFCDYCGRCIRTCPGKSIPTEKKMIDGIMRYQIDQESCYTRWRSLGTDCGICLSSCPVSQGVDPDLLKQKDYKEIIKRYTELYPIRPFIKEEYF